MRATLGSVCGGREEGKDGKKIKVASAVCLSTGFVLYISSRKQF